MRRAMLAMAAAMVACAGFIGLDEPTFDAVDGGVPPRNDATPEDAPSEAAPDGPRTYCSTFPSAAFCEDFDTITDISSLGLEATNDSIKGRLFQSEFRSPPRSLLFNLAPETAQFSVMTRAFPTDRAVRLSYDWWIRALEARDGQNIQLTTLRRKNDQLGFQRLCLAGDGGLDCKWYVVLAFLGSDASDKFKFFPLPARPPFVDNWTHVVVEAKFSPKDGYFKVSFDGTGVVDETRPTSEEDLPPDQVLSVTLGLGVLQGVEGTNDMVVDNFLVELL